MISTQHTNALQRHHTDTQHIKCQHDIQETLYTRRQTCTPWMLVKQITLVQESLLVHRVSHCKVKDSYFLHKLLCVLYKSHLHNEYRVYDTVVDGQTHAMDTQKLFISQLKLLHMLPGLHRIKRLLQCIRGPWLVLHGLVGVVWCFISSQHITQCYMFATLA